MSANLPVRTPQPDEELDGFPDYPGFGSEEDGLARMRLLEWIWQQVAEGKVQVEPGDHILATDGRIVGIGRDPDEVIRRVLKADPALRNARLVAYDVPPVGY